MEQRRYVTGKEVEIDLPVRLPIHTVKRHYDVISASIPLREACDLVCRQVRYGQAGDLGTKLPGTTLPGDARAKKFPGDSLSTTVGHLHDRAAERIERNAAHAL
jgi:hypothetical protein